MPKGDNLKKGISGQEESKKGQTGKEETEKGQLRTP